MKEWTRSRKRDVERDKEINLCYDTCSHVDHHETSMKVNFHTRVNGKGSWSTSPVNDRKWSEILWDFHARSLVIVHWSHGKLVSTDMGASSVQIFVIFLMDQVDRFHYESKGLG